MQKGSSLKNIFLKHKVAFAYQFGSSVSGQVHAESDVDIAVYLNRKLTPKEFLKKQLLLIYDLGLYFKKDVDLVILNQSKSIAFNHQIVSSGKIICEHDSTQRALFENSVLREYFDYVRYIELHREAYVA
jgi:predicted nucleotidyltransferase